VSKKETPKAAVQKTVYVGPTILGVAVRNTVYDGLPEELKKAAEALPYLAGLCIPFSGLGKALDQIQQQKGSSYRLFCMAQADSGKIQEIVRKAEVE